MVSPTAALRSASRIPSSTTATRAIWKTAARIRKATPTRSLPRSSRRSLPCRRPPRRPRPEHRDLRSGRGGVRAAGLIRRSEPFGGSLRLMAPPEQPRPAPRGAGLFFPCLCRAQYGLLEAAALAGVTGKIARSGWSMENVVRVLSTLALMGAVRSLAGRYQAAAGVRIDADFAPTLGLLDRLRGGENAD